jgi:hypothetical protein
VDKYLRVILSALLTGLDIVQEHGAIKGVMRFSQHIKGLIQQQEVAFDFAEFARLLRHEIQYNTLINNRADVVFVENGTLHLEPVLVPNGRNGYASELIGVIQRGSRYDATLTQFAHLFYFSGYTKVIPHPLPLLSELLTGRLYTPETSFDITRNFQSTYISLNPDEVVSTYEEITLSDNEINMLRPINNNKLLYLCTMSIKEELGNAKIAMFDGDLVVKTSAKCFKMLPVAITNDKDKYPSYRFTAMNRSKANKLLKKYVDLIDDDNKDIELPEDINGCIKMLQELRSETEHFFRVVYYGVFYVPQHRLSAWVHLPDYDKINTLQADASGKKEKYHIHHMDKNRFNNNPDNLRILTANQHAAYTDRSIGVTYGDTDYVSIRDYCAATSAGDYPNLRKRLQKLEDGEAVVVKKRRYEKNGESYIATDV